MPSSTSRMTAAIFDSRSGHYYMQYIQQWDFQFVIKHNTLHQTRYKYAEKYQRGCHAQKVLWRQPSWISNPAIIICNIYIVQQWDFHFVIKDIHLRVRSGHYQQCIHNNETSISHVKSIMVAIPIILALENVIITICEQDYTSR